MSDITVEVTTQPAIDVSVSPLGGRGPAGPSAVSADAGNTAVLGSDNLVYVPDSGTSGGGAWGEITGTLADQTDLATALAGKSNTGHTHTESDIAGLTSDLAGKAASVHTHAESDITGLTADLAGKAAAVHTHSESDITGLAADLAAKAPLASPAFTGTPTGITKAHVGLPNVDNTADAAKPVSTAQQTALNLKADLASPALTGNPTAPTASPGDNDTSIATTAFVTAAVAAGGSSKSARSDTTASYSYLGSAAAGTADSSSGWTITRISIASPPVITHGSGTWTGRAGLTYS